jgi:hypothetical protein
MNHIFPHPDDEHDAAVLAAARADAAAQYVALIEIGKPESMIPIEDLEGMPKEIPLLQMLTWISQEEGAYLLKACAAAMTGKDAEALHALREFVQCAADEYANNNVN